VGRTTLFTPVDINLEQVVDFLNFYAYTGQLKKEEYLIITGEEGSLCSIMSCECPVVKLAIATGDAV
jgi:hypothetical protein